jgi:hypothetical protein
MHPEATVASVLELHWAGLNNCQISRRTGVSRPTIRDWVNGKLPHSYRPKISVAGRPMHVGVCQRCNGDDHHFEHLSTAYAYLLGLYLGDGSIATHPRGVYRLRVSLDVRYPGIACQCEAAMRAVLPWNKANRTRKPDNCYEVYSYSKAWPCFLPQHGTGKKHHRRIELTDWQKELVDLVPGLLLRGLIHSDGHRFMNTGTNWAFPRYGFTNFSADILRIFCDACDRLGVGWTRSGERTIYVSRMADVALLDRFVGPKY